MRCRPLPGRHAVDRVWNASERRSASLSEMRPDLTGTGGGDQSEALRRLSCLRICFEARKCMCRLGAISTASPVLGLRPTRATRTLVKKLPNPRNSTLCPWLRVSAISSRIVSKAFSAASAVRRGFSWRSFASSSERITWSIPVSKRN